MVKFPFTNESINQFSKGVSKRVYAYDSGVSIKGFCAMFTEKGAISFYVYRKIKGVPIRKNLGQFGSVSIEEARALAKEFNLNGKIDALDGKDERKYKKIARAGEYTKNLIKEGLLKNPSELKCRYCGLQAQHYHHPDYSRPAHVIPVCNKCHAGIHSGKIA